MRTLTVANLTDFNRANLRKHHLPSDVEDWRRAGDELADMALFWGDEDAVALVPAGNDPAWSSDVCRRLGLTITIVQPRRQTGRLLDDILLDEAALAHLIALGGDGYDIRAWGATPALLCLVGVLRSAGVEAQIVAPTSDALWTVRHLESKLTLHSLAERLPAVAVAPSSVATDAEELLGLVRHLSAEGRPYVVKSHIGVGGFGTFASGAAVGTAPGRDVENLRLAMAAEPMFREGPYLVEDWIAGEPEALRPTFDGVVTDDGVQVVGVGGMLIDGVNYRGVAVGEVPIAEATIEQATAAGMAVGEYARRLGFRGWFDVDFVAGAKGRPFATEINARRTSPTHAFELLGHWERTDPEIRCVVADDHIPVPIGTGWRDVSRMLEEAAETKSGRCIATIVRTLSAPEPSLGVAAGASTYEAALRILSDLRHRAQPQGSPTVPTSVAHY